MTQIAVDALPDDERRLVQRWVENYERGKDRHEATRRKAERFYALYRSYRDLKRTYSDAKPKDVDSILNDARHGFGTDLFIPYAFSVIETTNARMLASNPTMKVRPAPTRAGVEALMRAEANSENHRVLIEKQLSQTDFNLAAQDVNKSSLKYGLGIGKTRWEEISVEGRKMLVPPTVREEGGPDWVLGNTNALVYQGPVSEWVDLFDWIHDPRGHDMKTLRWCIHRMWFDNDEIKRRIESGVWELPNGVELEELLSCGATEARTDLWRERMAAAGFNDVDETRGEHLHEVWECHDGEEVSTIIDRVCPVQHGPNPFWHGEMPFSIARSTRVEGEMLGIGEIEAIEDLQEEMNTMRSQRRDNAAFVLQRPFAYFEGLVDPSDLGGWWGPGIGLAVDGDPSNVLHFPPVQDIPASSYQEENNLARDIERATGLDDSTQGSASGANTATEVQAVQYAAGVRIENKTALFRQEFVKRCARHWLFLNQQKFGVGAGGANEPVHMIGPPAEGRPDYEESVERGWAPYEMGPETLAGDFDIEPDDGSMSPPNPVEKLERATRMMNMFGADEMVDPVWLREFVLLNMGVENPRAVIRLPEEQIASDEMQMAAEAAAVALGIDPAALMQLMQQGVQQAKEVKAMEQQAQMGGEAGQQQSIPEEPPPSPAG